MYYHLNRRRLLGWLGLGPAIVVGAPAAVGQTVRAPVRVLFTRVNGEPYYEAGTSVPTLAAGDRVVLRREPDNPHDRRAIEVLAARGAKLGYVARSSEEHTSELQSLMRNSYAVFCLKKKNT